MFLAAKPIRYMETWATYGAIYHPVSLTHGGFGFHKLAQELSKSENKSRNIKRGKGLQFSSIDGWTEDKLPKLLIVWNFERIH